MLPLLADPSTTGRPTTYSFLPAVCLLSADEDTPTCVRVNLKGPFQYPIDDVDPYGAEWPVTAAATDFAAAAHASFGQRSILSLLHRANTSNTSPSKRG